MYTIRKCDGEQVVFIGGRVGVCNNYDIIIVVTFTISKKTPAEPDPFTLVTLHDYTSQRFPAKEELQDEIL